MEHMTPAGALDSRQFVFVIMLGAMLWFIAAMLLRILAPIGVYEGSARVILYVLTVPGIYPFLLIVRQAAKLGRDQIIPGLAIATGTAALLDGIALAWLPALYGSQTAHVAGAGAAILWGVGVVMGLGVVMARPGRP